MCTEKWGLRFLWDRERERESEKVKSHVREKSEPVAEMGVF